MNVLLRALLPAILALALAGPARAADAMFVPGDAAGFLSVDVVKLRKNASADLVRLGTDGLLAEDWAKMVKAAGFDVTTVERVMVIAPTFETLAMPLPRITPTSKSAILAVTCSAAFDPAALCKAFGPESRPKQYKEATYQFEPETWSGLFTLPGNKTFLIASEDSLVWYLDRLMGKGKAKEFPAIGSLDHTAVLAVNPERIPLLGNTLPDDLRPLAEAKLLTVTLDLETKIKAEFKLEFTNEPAAKAGLAAVGKATELGRKLIAVGQEQLEKEAEPRPYRNHYSDRFIERGTTLVAAGFLRRVDKELQALPAVQAGASVTVAYDKLAIPEWSAVPALLTAATLLSPPYPAYSPERSDPVKEAELRTKLFEAFQAYVAKHGHYPPAATLDKQGKPALSWRVALLPFMGEKDLYNQFKHDEPWDSLHNKTLIERIPKVYGSASGLFDVGQARPFVVVGPGTVFDPKAKVKKADLQDPANTILWIETYSYRQKWSNIYWTKPLDAEFVGATPPDFFPPESYRPSIQAMMADGTWRTIENAEAAKNLPGLFLVKKPK